MRRRRRPPYIRRHIVAAVSGCPWQTWPALGDTRAIEDHFQGGIDEVAVFDRTLSAAEIEELATCAGQKR